MRPSPSHSWYLVPVAGLEPATYFLAQCSSQLSYTSILGNQNCTGGAATLPLLRPGHIGKGGNVKRENASRCRVQGWLPAAVWQLCPAYGQETGVPVHRCERRCTMEGQNRRISHPRCLWHDTILARIYPEKITCFLKFQKTHHFLMVPQHVPPVNTDFSPLTSESCPGKRPPDG